MLTFGTAPDVAIPPRTGIGLRAEHFIDVLKQRPDVGWFEAHSENYFGIGDSGLSGRGGSKPLEYLEQVRQLYPVSLHGVGLSVGSTDPINQQHLSKLKSLIDYIQPGLISEHLSWGSVGGQYFNDLLPMPYTEEALEHVTHRIERVQEILGRQILIENVSSYLEYKASSIPEWEFVAAVSQKTGCGILLDVNNIYINAKNHGFNPDLFIQNVPVEKVKEIHLAGHTVKEIDGGVIRLDTHDQLVCDDVWRLYQQATERFENVPALIEWDRNLPELSVLLEEARRADDIRESVTQKNHQVSHERIA